VGEVEHMVRESLLAIHNKRQRTTPSAIDGMVHAIARYKFIDLLRRGASRDLITDPLDDEIDILSSPDSEAAEAKGAWANHLTNCRTGSDCQSSIPNW